MPDVYLDGSFTSASVHGPLNSVPVFDYDHTTLMFRQKFWQLFANFAPLALNTLGSASGLVGVGSTPAYLIAETERVGIGAGIVEWERVWCHRPPSRSVIDGSTSYNYKITSGAGGSGQIVSFGLELPQQKTATYYIGGPGGIPIKYPPELVIIGNSYFNFNFDPGPGPVPLGDPIGAYPSGTVLNNRGTDIHVWKGNIWEAIDYTVTIHAMPL